MIFNESKPDQTDVAYTCSLYKYVSHGPSFSSFIVLIFYFIVFFFQLHTVSFSFPLLSEKEPKRDFLELPRREKRGRN